MLPTRFSPKAGLWKPRMWSDETEPVTLAALDAEAGPPTSGDGGTGWRFFSDDLRGDSAAGFDDTDEQLMMELAA